MPAPAHLVVVGHDRNPARYRALARRHRVAARVTFAGPQADPRPFYGAADVFLLPTLYDPLSNAVLEALACGLPVITSTRCGAGELVAAHRAGVVCGARDIGAIAMRCMRCSRSRCASARRPTRCAPCPILTPDAMAARLIALYQALLDNNRATTR